MTKLKDTTFHLDIPEQFRVFLKSRGVEGEDQLRRFLLPRLADLPRPEQMANLTTAAELVAEALRHDREIIIWGDYDVDGTTGTALLVNFFKEYGARVSWHIPNRFTEGYGLNSQWFRDRASASRNRDFLLITVDCGISNREQVAEIQRFGATVIVTDHHQLPAEGLPQCLIVNPSLPHCGFHGHQLSGAGVAFYLAAAIKTILAPRFPHIQINLKQYLAFVALGTVADVVPMTATNRILVRAGLEALTSTPFQGVKELLSSCSIAGADLYSEDIAFFLGPKINAAGRLGDSDLAVSLLTEESASHARKLAARLTLLNDQRKALCVEILEKAISELSPGEIQQAQCIIVKEVSHQGVAGIVASKLVELFRFPALVFAKTENQNAAPLYVGSARSVEGINMVDMLRQCAPLLERYGGHKMAAGLSLREDAFPAFAKAFSQLAAKAYEDRVPLTRRRFDIPCAVDELLTDRYLNIFKYLDPFGPGNEAPIFFDKQSKIVDARTVGREMEHLQVSIRGRYVNHKGIGFGLGKKISEVQSNPTRSLLYSPTVNRYRGTVSWQVRVIDL